MWVYMNRNKDRNIDVFILGKVQEMATSCEFVLCSGPMVGWERAPHKTQHGFIKETREKKKKANNTGKKKEVSLLKCNNNGNKKQKSETGMEAVELEEFVV